MSFGPQVFWDRELCIEILKFLAMQMYDRIISILSLLYGHDTSPKFSNKYYGLGVLASLKNMHWLKFDHSYSLLSLYTTSLAYLNMISSPPDVLFFFNWYFTDSD